MNRAPLLFAAISLWPAGASAYTFICTTGAECTDPGQAVHWDRPEMPVPYKIGPGPANNDQETVDQVIQGVFQQWTDVECSYVSLVYDGAVDWVRNEDDGVNLVAWCGAGCLGGGGALGVATPIFDWSGLIIDCDEFMDGMFSWTTDPRDELEGYTLAQAVVAQESGHCLGMGHSQVETATMYPAYMPATGFETLDPDDEEGICALYPVDEGCTRDSDCREGSCVNGQCSVVPEGPRELGMPCDEPEQCLSALCISPDGGASVCSQDCEETEPGSGCPGGFWCRQLDTCDEGACVAGSLGTTANTLPCDSDDECASGRCAQLEEGRVCASPCDPDDGSCGGDASCVDVPGPCGACGGGDPPRDVGDPCEDGAECLSGRCVGFAGNKRCTRECDEADDCPDGWVCEGGLCFVQDEGTICAPCNDDGDCVSRLCVSGDGAGFCSRECDGETDCPDGYSCVERVGVRACEPDAACFGQACDETECLDGYLCGQIHGEKSCTRECDDEHPCPNDYECVEGNSEGTVWVCVADGDGDDRGGGGGCGCRAAGAGAGARWALGVALLAVMLLGRRRRT
ncbi:MAG: matrixin family metalloprotease [Deltaproteobacteria bacterium]|nr:matrixin family metalloprotease [Deltaproteobacteria bacterium]